jgi:hypothetical protein
MQEYFVRNGLAWGLSLSMDLPAVHCACSLVFNGALLLCCYVCRIMSHVAAMSLDCLKAGSWKLEAAVAAVICYAIHPSLACDPR